MTCLVSKINYFQVLSMVQCFFIRLGGGGKKVTAILRRSSSTGLGTAEVKIASVPVPAFTSRQQNGVEQLTDARRRTVLFTNSINLHGNDKKTFFLSGFSGLLMKVLCTMNKKR